ncbi:MAG: type I DNA topoisomerase, partial [Candidatus Sumerlaeia bacterium]|nr:type I DNA topoisomerase [Candidatus Sumerlaeia bacterium]
MTSLVIVESPAKAKTISNFLGKGYRVEASFGHVRDLPASKKEVPEAYKKEKWAEFAVNIEDEFQPIYVVSPEKRKHVAELKRALKDADELILATDEDREGESISWHLLELLKPKVPVRRIVFHEITREAIKAAMESPREVDNNLVRAQESRRIVDRLFGYKLSPVLWRKVQRGLSAGRVQSAALRLIVEREEDRRAFHSSVYWDLEAEINSPTGPFKVTLVSVGGKRLASGKDFDPATGKLKNSAVFHLDNEDKTARLRVKVEEALPWEVTAVEDKPASQRPYPPFTTSTLQQEANRKLGFTAKPTMRIAQRLYEGINLGEGERVGLITYMRTDSVVLSERAMGEAQNVIRRQYGEEYAKGFRPYKTKARNAQEAHEAIRPTELSRLPQAVKRYLDKEELDLYELIWKRTLARHMPDPKLLRTTVEITA